MALSVGSSWASVSLSSTPLNKRSEPTLWRLIEGQRYELRHLTNVKAKKGKLTYGALQGKAKFLKRKLTSFATSEGQPPYNELDVEDSQNDKMSHTIVEDDSVRSSSHIHILRTAGKPGFISFHGLPYERQDEIQEPDPSNEPSNFIWFIGPTILVASLVFPSLYLRRILSTVFEDSLFTDFLILFFTEALFYCGVAIFVLLIDHVWGPQQPGIPKINGPPKPQFGLRVSSVAILVLSLIIPLVTMGMVWPWTGPAASATLAPYLVGIVVQFAFEQYARHQKSTAWPVIPVVFQVYRLHQLNRAAQLVTALTYSVRGAEITSQILVINNSLGTLLNVLQLLGVICIWSLSSFLMRFIPSSPIIPDL